MCRRAEVSKVGSIHYNILVCMLPWGCKEDLGGGLGFRFGGLKLRVIEPRTPKI